MLHYSPLPPHYAALLHAIGELFAAGCLIARRYYAATLPYASDISAAAAYMPVVIA